MLNLTNNALKFEGERKSIKIGHHFFSLSLRGNTMKYEEHINSEDQIIVITPKMFRI